MRRLAQLAFVALLFACGSGHPGPELTSSDPGPTDHSGSTSASPAPVPTAVCSDPEPLPVLPDPPPGTDDCDDILRPLPAMTTYQVFVDRASYACWPDGDILLPTSAGSGGTRVSVSWDPTAGWTVQAFGADGCPLWPARAPGIEGAGEVWSGVDDRGRILLLQQGGLAPGIWGRWFDRDGTALTGAFRVADGPLPGDTGSMETANLYGGGLAVKTVGWVASLRTGIDVLLDEWIAIVPSGSTDARPAPEWLASRPFTQLWRTRGGYAVLPEYEAAASPCGDRVEILNASGAACGALDLPIDSAPCSPAPAVGVGRGGTLFQVLPFDRATPDPADASRVSCTIRFWPAALP